MAEALYTLKIWRGAIRREQIVSNPHDIEFEDIFIDDTVYQCIDIIDMGGMTSRNYLSRKTTMELAVQGDEYKLSRTIDGELKDTLKIEMDGSATAFVYYMPKAVRKTQGKITMKTPAGRGTTRISGNGEKVRSRRKTELTWPNIRETSENAEMTIKLSKLKGVVRDGETFNIEGDYWPAEIDENGNRYFQIKISSKDKNVKIKNIRMKTSGDMCYRMAYSYGDDFYHRSVIGERVETAKDWDEQDKYNTNIQINKGEIVLIRVYPWSQQEGNGKRFSITNMVLEGMATE